MAAGANAEFIKRRARFLEDHLILLNDTNNRLIWNQIEKSNKSFLDMKNYGTFEFDLTRVTDPNVEGWDATGKKKLKVFELKVLTRATTKRTNIINAYFCPYQNNMDFTIQLGTEADFFFTPTMNGCTVAVGSGAMPKITHANLMDPVTQLFDQPRVDARMNQIHGTPALTLKKTDYTDVRQKSAGLSEAAGLKNWSESIKDWQAVLIGFRVGNAWNFYYQNQVKSLSPSKKGGGFQTRYQILRRAQQLQNWQSSGF